MTSDIERKWRSSATDATPYAIWQYVIVTDKMLRVFPGARINKAFQAKDLYWYVRNVSLGDFCKTAP